MVKKASHKEVVAEVGSPQITSTWIAVFVGVLAFVGLVGARVADKYGDGSPIQQANTSSNVSTINSASTDTQSYSNTSGLQPTINVVQP